MTADDKKLETARLTSRADYFRSCSTEYLREFANVLDKDLGAINAELAARGVRSAVPSAFPRADTYQEKAHAFAAYGGNPMYPALGLAEEAGETCGKIAKFIRKHAGDAPMTLEYELTHGVTATDDYIRFLADLRKELGDVLWMVAELCTVYGLHMGDVMTGNLEKLADRKDKGLIIGEGDTNEERIANSRSGK